MKNSSDKSDVDVTCPFCRGHLVVDSQTGAVVDSTPPPGSTRSFDDVLGEVTSASERHAKSFERAFKQERKRQELLEKKFSRVQDKLRGGEEPEEGGSDEDR